MARAKRSFRFRWFVAVLLAVALPVTLFLMGGRPPPKASGKAGPEARLSTYTIADPTGDWGFPSPYGMYPRGPGYVRMSLVFDTLLWKDEDGPTGALAEDWSHDESEGTYSFRLRPGLKWHDDRPLTADDVVFTFEYMREHPWPWSDLGAIDKVEALDEQTVRISLSRPYAPFPSNIAGAVPILPRHVWEGVEAPEEFREPEALIGSGPYELADYDRTHGTYLYEAWDDYHLGRPLADTLRFVRYSQEMTPAALRGGRVNAGPVPAEALENLEAGGFELETEPPVWAAKLMMNHRQAPLSDRRFRQAIAHALDRERIVRIVRRGHGIPGSIGLIPPSNRFWHNPDVATYNHDEERARALLMEAGYAPGPDGTFRKDGNRLELELAVSGERQEMLRLAEMVARQLRDAGIDVRTRGVEAKALDSMLGEGRFDLALSGHGGLGGDPEILNKVIIGDLFTSAGYYENAEMVTLLKEQLRQTCERRRRRKVHRIQELYAYELPAITLYHPKSYWGHDGKATLFHTPGGMAIGIPIPLNKLSFVERE